MADEVDAVTFNEVDVGRRSKSEMEAGGWLDGVEDGVVAWGPRRLALDKAARRLVGSFGSWPPKRSF